MPAARLLADQRRDHEEEQRHHVFGVGDGEGVERRQEEEVVGQHAEQARQQRRPQPPRRRRRQHGGQKHQRDAGDREDMPAALARPAPPPRRSAPTPMNGLRVARARLGALRAGCRARVPAAPRRRCTGMSPACAISPFATVAPQPAAATRCRDCRRPRARSCARAHRPEYRAATSRPGIVTASAPSRLARAACSRRCGRGPASARPRCRGVSTCSAVHGARSRSARRRP